LNHREHYDDRKYILKFICDRVHHSSLIDVVLRKAKQESDWRKENCFRQFPHFALLHVALREKSGTASLRCCHGFARSAFWDSRDLEVGLVECLSIHISEQLNEV